MVIPPGPFRPCGSDLFGRYDVVFDCEAPLGAVEAAVAAGTAAAEASDRGPVVSPHAATRSTSKKEIIELFLTGVTTVFPPPRHAEIRSERIGVFALLPGNRVFAEVR